MPNIMELPFWTTVSICISIIVGMIFLGLSIGYSMSYGNKKWSLYLDHKILSKRKANFLIRLKTLDDLEIINKELNLIRELESKLDVDHFDFSKDIEEYEKTSKLVKDRGYI